jgi:hypothetical protein
MDEGNITVEIYKMISSDSPFSDGVVFKFSLTLLTCPPPTLGVGTIKAQLLATFLSGIRVCKTWMCFLKLYARDFLPVSGSN